MKDIIISFIHNLVLYDYLLFGAIFAIFLLLVILIIVIRHHTILALLMLFIAILFLFISPIFGYIKLNHLLYNHTCTLTKVQQLKFSPALLIKGKITNLSNKTFKKCAITASISKTMHYKFINKLFALNPFQTMSIIKYNIKPTNSKKIQMIIQPFTAKGTYQVSLKAVCR